MCDHYVILLCSLLCFQGSVGRKSLQPYEVSGQVVPLWILQETKGTCIVHSPAHAATSVCIYNYARVCGRLQVKSTCLYLAGDLGSCEAYTRTCAHTHIHAHLHAHTRTHTYMCGHMRTLTRTHARAHTRAHSLVRDLTRQTHNYAKYSQSLPYACTCFFAPTCTHDAVKEL